MKKKGSPRALLFILSPGMFLFILIFIHLFHPVEEEHSWIRVNLLGYKPGAIKVAVWCSTEDHEVQKFRVIHALTEETVFEGKAGKPFGAYGPFRQVYRLDFSAVSRPGSYILEVGSTRSPVISIHENVYDGAADFCLRYMRQQRSGFNPFLKDSCHTHDGYTMYGPMPDSTHIDVSGGWHDATDYLQYVTTSATATYHLLAAYRDFPSVFQDLHLANGLTGRNQIPDVLDEARWGLDWLLKMHPRENGMFNQVADDRDHKGFRLPREDDFYGKGFERPVYFCTGEPQGLGKYKNRTTGVASTAGKFSSAFALGNHLLKEKDPTYAQALYQRAFSAYRLGLEKPGVCQTASCVSPYFYEEDNWTDDMELAAVMLYGINQDPGFLREAQNFARLEKITPWMGTDTARHYQWYPFVNPGHAELIRVPGKHRKEILSYYKEGIDRIWKKGRSNGFLRGIPFIWCSNNLTTAFAIQCYWYRTLSGDDSYAALEQACFDWLFGVNPWGTSFVYGLPANADTPADPHSSFTHLFKYPVDGGLVDGPVYASIYNNLKGITLTGPDEYARFQSDLVVYHDDVGDYSTNEPTMDGTATLIYLLAALQAGQ